MLAQQAADIQSYHLMLKASGLEDYPPSDDISKLNGETLRTLDQLWVDYSNGRFGFSVHKDILENVRQGWPDAVGSHYTGWYSFCECVGWRVNGKFITTSKVNFSMNAPRGHLPWTWWVFLAWVEDGGNCYWNMVGTGQDVDGRFFKRLQVCLK